MPCMSKKIFFFFRVLYGMKLDIASDVKSDND